MIRADRDDEFRQMARLLNTTDRYGTIPIVLHWLSAAVIVAMFCLGYWMVDLDYYHAWYKRAPDIHKGIGILFAAVFACRWLVRVLSPLPAPATGTRPLQAAAARLVHRFFYLLIACQLIAGYLISTADGRPIRVFGWFDVPATITAIPNQEDVAGEIHWYLGVSLISLAALHGLAALKHHFVDRDATLLRMFGRNPHANATRAPERKPS